MPQNHLSSYPQHKSISHFFLPIVFSKFAFKCITGSRPYRKERKSITLPYSRKGCEKSLLYYGLNQFCSLKLGIWKIPSTSPSSAQSAAAGSRVLDVSSEQKRLGWGEEEKSGWSSVTLTHEALISREEVKQKRIAKSGSIMVWDSACCACSHICGLRGTISWSSLVQSEVGRWADAALM